MTTHARHRSHTTATAYGWGPVAPGDVWRVEEGYTTYRQAVARMRRFTYKQLVAALHGEGGRLLAPHGLAYFFWEPPETVVDDGVMAGTRLRCATRMFWEAEHITDAASTVDGLASVARTVLDGGGWDLVSALATSGEPMSAAARYMGVALSTFDVADAPWSGARRQVPGQIVGTRVLAWMVDGHRFRIEARLRNLMGDHDVQCTWGTSGYGLWRWVADPTDDETFGAWRALWDLHRLFMQAQRSKDIQQGPWGPPPGQAWQQQGWEGGGH